MCILIMMLAAAAIVADPPHACDWCDAANAPREPFNVHGDTWYVGTRGLTSILVTSPQGHILIDGALPQSAPLIAANIEKLGFALGDVKLILNTHTHYDHAGGIAALQRASGAQVAASPAATRALERGGPTEDDPQFAFGGKHNDFPVVRNVRTISDGETLRVGTVAITAHFTPGHTPGGTTWTWRSCAGEDCANVVYADSLNAVSAPGYRFGDAGHPRRVQQFQKSIARVAALACDILLVPHPEQTGMDAKLAARAHTMRPDSFRRAGQCIEYAEAAGARLIERLRQETSAK